MPDEAEAGCSRSCSCDVGRAYSCGRVDRAAGGPDRGAGAAPDRRGTRVLERALHRHPGPYQLPGAFAALHLEDETDWPQIVVLYELGEFTPSPIGAEPSGRRRDGRRTGTRVGLVRRIDLPEYHLLHAARADFPPAERRSGPRPRTEMRGVGNERRRPGLPRKASAVVRS
jgi:hypothetical protein